MQATLAVTLAGPDSYLVTIYVFWGERRLGVRLRRARGITGREEGKIPRAPQPNPQSSLTPNTHK